MAMTAVPIGVLPSNPLSHTTPLTPRAKATKLTFDPTMAGMTLPILTTRTVAAPLAEAPVNGTRSEIEGEGDNTAARTSMDSMSDNEGRMTPVPNPDATIRRNQPHSPRFNLPPREPSQPTSSSSSTHTVPARTGFGSLHGEEQLKISLQTKDRIFVVMLSNEIEAFIQRCLKGEQLRDAQTATALPGGTALAVFGTNPTIRIQSKDTSKYQRMLVYKAAEWYGVKAVSGPDNVIYMGLVETLQEKSASLKLAALVPGREATPQKFKIMKRSQNADQSRSISADGGEGGPTSRKTLEQREAEYAAERERIYGPTQSEPEEVVDRPVTRHVEEEIDPVSRYAYGIDAMSTYEPIYASLYHNPAQVMQVDPPINPSNGVYYQAVPYPGYPMVGPGMPGMQYAGYGNGVPMYTQQAFDQHGNPIMLVPQQMNGYAAPMWQTQPMGTSDAVPQQQMMVPPQVGGNGWSHPGQPYQNGGHRPVPPSSNPRQYQPGYPTYPGLVHPQPTRPHPHAQQSHSSTSSSMSSHGHHSTSRPHSRGSTTSTRSAASSALFGQMHPTNGMLRQKGIKGVNTLTALGIAQERRSKRGQSPSSTTTTSSRSSRSIPVQPPSDFPLPQRPDWTIPQKSSIPPTLSSTSSPYPASRSHPSTSPSQSSISGNSESKVMSSNGSAEESSSDIDIGTDGVPSPAPLSHPSETPSQPTHQHPTETGPDYQRGPAPRITQTLYNPSVPSPSSRPVSSNGNQQVTTFPSNTKSNGNAIPIDTSSMSPEDIIEAKLQALSFSTGVEIGPPRAKVVGASYAKAVRRD